MTKKPTLTTLDTTADVLIGHLPDTDDRAFKAMEAARDLAMSNVLIPLLPDPDSTTKTRTILNRTRPGNRQWDVDTATGHTLRFNEGDGTITARYGDGTHSTIDATEARRRAAQYHAVAAAADEFAESQDQEDDAE